ncbi:DUF401 family protein [Candidatus Sumerlaeota bacterium]|nr:DUF401 family protein [Candidatus Sumerlaeota bacterium]
MIDWIHSLSASIKLALTLLSLVGVMRAKAPLGAAFFFGAVVLWFFFPVPSSVFAWAVVKGLSSGETLLIVCIVVILMSFSSALKTTGQIDRIIQSFRAVVGPSRISLVAFPALIGLLPMPGGAIFSAPMVEAAVKDVDISSTRSTVANYWFRHVWEFWFPLFPGVILFLTLTQVPIGQFALRQIPLTALAFVLGYVFILRGVRMGDGPRRRDYSRRTVTAFLRELIPIFIVVGTVVLVIPIVGRLADVLGIENKFLQNSFLVLGLFFGLIWLFFFRGLTWIGLGRLIVGKHILTMVAMVFGLMVFKSVVESCGAVGQLQEEIDARGLSTPVAISVLGFVSGLVMGIGFGFVGASFPFIIPLVEALNLSPSLVTTHYALAFSSGFVGMMLSPVHICFLLTSAYFKSNTLRAYYYLVPINLLTIAGAWLLFFFFRAVGS